MWGKLWAGLRPFSVKKSAPWGANIYPFRAIPVCGQTVLMPKSSYRFVCKTMYHLPLPFCALFNNVYIILHVYFARNIIKTCVTISWTSLCLESHYTSHLNITPPKCDLHTKKHDPVDKQQDEVIFKLTFVNCVFSGTHLTHRRDVVQLSMVDLSHLITAHIFIWLI